MIRSAHAPVYQCKITLCGVIPSIWRRFQVRSDITLADLHEVLQAVMGWENYHPYDFSYGKQRFGEPDDECSAAGIEITDSEKVTLGQVTDRVEEKFNYRYDFGDGWRHEIEVEKIFHPDKAFSHLICLEGARACPPEDCGGTRGYEELLWALGNMIPNVQQFISAIRKRADVQEHSSPAHSPRKISSNRQSWRARQNYRDKGITISAFSSGTVGYF